MSQDIEGRTRRDRLESRLERAIRKGRSDIAAGLEFELATPPFPIGLLPVWNAWSRIRNRKGPGMMGPAPIEWPDIDSFIRRSGTVLTPADVEYIEIIDNEFVAAFRAQASADEQNQAIKDSLKQAAQTTGRQ